MKCPMCREHKVFDQKLFINTTIQCSICLETKDSTRFMLANCGHAVCEDCIAVWMHDSDDGLDRDSTLEPLEWLRRYEHNTTSVSRHWMLRKHWPSQVIEHIEAEWVRYPKVGNWPECSWYYRLS